LYLFWLHIATIIKQNIYQIKHMLIYNSLYLTSLVVSIWLCRSFVRIVLDKCMNAFLIPLPSLADVSKYTLPADLANSWASYSLTSRLFQNDKKHKLLFLGTLKTIFSHLLFFSIWFVSNYYRKCFAFALLGNIF